MAEQLKTKKLAFVNVVGTEPCASETGTIVDPNISAVIPPNHRTMTVTNTNETEEGTCTVKIAKESKGIKEVSL